MAVIFAPGSGGITSGTPGPDLIIGSNNEDIIFANGAISENEDPLGDFVEVIGDEELDDLLDDVPLGDIVDGSGKDDIIFLGNAVAPNLVCDGEGNDAVFGSDTPTFVFLDEGDNTILLGAGEDLVRIDESSSAEGEGSEGLSTVSLGAGADTVWLADLPEDGFVFVDDFEAGVDALVVEQSVVDNLDDIEVVENPEGFAGWTLIQWENEQGGIYINATLEEVLASVTAVDFDTEVFCPTDLIPSADLITA
jgi:Ca2+-binding RTX toxin-like protein